MSLLSTLGQYSTDYTTTSSTGPSVAFLLVYCVVLIVFITSLWKVFVKAGKPGWAAIIPVYNFVVFLQIVKRPMWWILLMFIPLVSMIVTIIIYNDLAKAFGKGVGTTILLLLLGIGFIILGFDKSTYQPQNLGRPATQ